MIHVASKQEVQAYYESPDLGQSALKKILEGISEFGRKEDSSKEHFVIGSAVDCILTGQEEDFKQDYFVSEIEKKPSDAIALILDNVYKRLLEDYAEYLVVVDPVKFEGDHFKVTQDNLEENPVQSTFTEFVGALENWETYLLDAAQEWNPKWGAEAKMKNLVVWQEYFTDLCNSFGKTILSSTQNETIKSIVTSLRSNPRTSRFFDRESYADVGNISVYYQFPVYFEYRGVKCKALLDIVIVVKDLEGKIVSIQPVDLKTMHGNTYYFSSSLKARRYDIQAAWYTLALSEYFQYPFEAIENFIFVVESTTYQGKPLAFQVTDELLDIGQYGRPGLRLIDTNLFDPNQPASEPIKDVILVREILGFEKLLDKFIYHNENGWNEEKELQETPVETPLLLSWEGIVTDNII